jgi:hypothetical protein
MNYEQLEERSLSLADGLDEIAGVIGGQLGLEGEAKKLSDRAQQVREDRFRVLVIGEFKRGKSTLLNAMLGDDILPRKVTEATAVVTLIQYGDVPEVRVFFDNGQPEEVLSLTNFRQRYELTMEDSEDREVAMDRFSHVEHAVLSFPIELCRHRIELVDSPGLGAHQTRTLRTQKFLPHADAIIFVLNAQQFLGEDESHFLESILLPLGLRNIFFIVNGWNLIDEAVINPEDAARERADLEDHIRRRLNPFCVVGGRDLSAERIFRVNALGALKARMRKPPLASLLEESNVPAFEESLQRFLVEDRGRARTDAILGVVKTATGEVNRFIETQQALANESIEKIEASWKALQPKLDRLRGIRQHILGFLDSQSANLQDRLVISYQTHIRKIEERLPEEVEQFDLTDIVKGSMVWASITDWAREDENKFAKRVERSIKPQVQKLLERHFATWQQSVVNNEMQAVKIDVDKHLQEEAAEYRRVLQEIEERIGIHSSTIQIQELVDRWMGESEQKGGATFELSGGGVMGDLSWLVGGIAIDVAAEVLFHMATLWVPVVGLVVTGIRMLVREGAMRQQIRDNIVLKIREALTLASQTKSAEIRAQIRESFDGLKDKIAGNIDSEIAIIDASVQSIIERKKSEEFSAEQEQARLEAARAAMAAATGRIQSALLAH